MSHDLGCSPTDSIQYVTDFCNVAASPPLCHISATMCPKSDAGMICELLGVGGDRVIKPVAFEFHSRTQPTIAEGGEGRSGSRSCV